MDLAEQNEFASKYAEAWSSQDPDAVASFYVENGSLTVNDGPPAVGRKAIAGIASGFMTDFPDMVVILDEVVQQHDGIIFHWTTEGTNSGPGGTGRQVRFSGYEVWQMSPDGLILESRGHYDSSQLEYQLNHGLDD